MKWNDAGLSAALLGQAALWTLGGIKVCEYRHQQRGIVVDKRSGPPKDTPPDDAPAVPSAVQLSFNFDDRFARV